MDVLDIARWQFGIITVYHFLFVPLTVGLTALIAGGQYHPAIAGQLKEAEANGDGMAAPAYAAIFVHRDRLRVALLDAMARQRLDAVLYPHQRRLVAAIGDEQLERNGVLSLDVFPEDMTAPLVN